jgi:hypothetical protein
VNSILSTLGLDTPLDGMLPHAETLCVIRYKFHQGRRRGDKGRRRDERRMEKQDWPLILVDPAGHTSPYPDASQEPHSRPRTRAGRTGLASRYDRTMAGMTGPPGRSNRASLAAPPTRPGKRAGHTGYHGRSDRVAPT